MSSSSTIHMSNNWFITRDAFMANHFLYVSHITCLGTLLITHLILFFTTATPHLEAPFFADAVCMPWKQYPVSYKNVFSQKKICCCIIEIKKNWIVFWVCRWEPFWFGMACTADSKNSMHRKEDFSHLFPSCLYLFSSVIFVPSEMQVIYTGPCSNYYNKCIYILSITVCCGSL